MTAVPQKDLIHFLPGFSSSAMLCAKYGAAETQGACDARTHENDVLSIAEEIDAIEEKIRRAVVDGLRLSDARPQRGYHQLQSKPK